MNWTKIVLRFSFINCAIFLVLITLSSAQEIPFSTSTLEFKQPPLSPRGAPGDRTGGGTRNGNLIQDNCTVLATEEQLTALVPEFIELNQPHRTHILGLTATASPSFWFYIPYQTNVVGNGKFELWDESEPNPRNYQQVYQGDFSITETPGVIRLSLPPRIKLETGKNYHWYLSVPLDCNSETIDVHVHGWIQRVEKIPQITESLSDREQVILLAQNGIWQDALTLLADLRSNDPDNPIFAADWEKLLRDVDLENLASQEIISCCTLSKK